MTSEIATSLQDVLDPLGVAVVVEAEHFCVSTRGVHKRGAKLVTSHFTGMFVSRKDARDKFVATLQIAARLRGA